MDVIINFGEPRTIELPDHSIVLMGSTVLSTNDFIIYKPQN